ncbi:MAG: ATP-binding protein [Oscillatoria sp. PMC 1068.18]|nr:ATP-binding protein [Oscillatoria sp. PMC 1076.18]MEC4989638.1 ATP-binding protein [Oscillatoria sp. PMC 1068.18]
MAKIPISVLVLEDSESDAAMLHQIFSRSTTERWELVTVERLEKALEICQSRSFDVALIDLYLPDSDGLDTVTTFLKTVTDVPVVVLTVENNEELALKSLGKGAQDYLVKGHITPELLLRAIRYAIERGRLLVRLQEVNQELESFSYSVAHDLRSPLRAIEAFAKFLQVDYEDRLDEEGVDYLKRIITSSERMSNLIEDLLSYSRLSRKEINLSSVDLESIVTEAIAQQEPIVEEKQAKIIVEKPLSTVIGNETSLLAIISNLISNALKFVASEVQPEIIIWSEEYTPKQEERIYLQRLQPQWVRLWIADNGIGISEQHQDKIFGIFERLHTQEAYPGTGIGLAIAQKAISRMGGKLGLESELDRGSRFWVDLPKYTQENPHQQREADE